MRAASQPAVGADPQRSIRTFIQRLYARARQPVAGSECGKVIAVVTVQAILGAHPQESRAILQHRLDRQVLQPLLFAVELEIVALSPCGRRSEQHAPRAISQTGRRRVMDRLHSLNSAVLIEFIRRYGERGSSSTPRICEFAKLKPSSV